MAAALTAMAPGLIGFALILHLSRALYAVDHGRAAVIATAGGWGVSAIGAALVPLLFASRERCAVPGCVDYALRTEVMAVLGVVGTAGMVVAGVSLLLAVRRHLGPDALGGVWRALGVLLVAAPWGPQSGGSVPVWLGAAEPSSSPSLPVSIRRCRFDASSRRSARPRAGRGPAGRARRPPARRAARPRPACRRRAAAAEGMRGSSPEGPDSASATGPTGADSIRTKPTDPRAVAACAGRYTTSTPYLG